MLTGGEDWGNEEPQVTGVEVGLNKRKADGGREAVKVGARGVGTA